MKLLTYGFDPAMVQEDTRGVIARVTATHKERYELICEHGQCFGRLKSGTYYGACTEVFPTTGDFVVVDYNASGDSRILKTLPRKSKFARSDFSGHAVGYVKTVLE